MLITDLQLKESIIHNGLIDKAAYAQIEEYSKNSGISIADALIERDVVTDENLGILIADFIKIPFIVLGKTSIPSEVFSIIPEKLARKQKVIPFARDENSVKVAMADPTNKELQEMIAKKIGLSVIPYLATEQDIYNTLRIYSQDIQLAIETILSAPNVSIAKIVDMLINYAYQDRASDIHIEPEEKYSLVRLRIDGILHDILFLPKVLHDQIITRIKILSRLRTDEHLAPQDGKLRTIIDKETLDIRVSILPIVDGEKAALRLLTSRFGRYSLSDLGMSKKDLEKVRQAYTKAYGMILSTGPTGSGKTTSIYSVLKILNVREKNITTIEDPVEYRIKGVNQINVNPKTNLTFATGLRSILRQDPNIVFVGEIRDGETAEIAVNASLTGHLVVSTLHTNDAATALPRLIDMDIEPFLVASTVSVIIAQRLVRKICDMCKETRSINVGELEKNLPADVIKKHLDGKQNITAYQGSGCKVCHLTGYAGRIGVFEILEVSRAIRELIVQRKDSDVIADQAIKEGMTTMLDDGLDKVMAGLTTIEEVLRVTKVDSG